MMLGRIKDTLLNFFADPCVIAALYIFLIVYVSAWEAHAYLRRPCWDVNGKPIVVPGTLDLGCDVTRP